MSVRDGILAILTIGPAYGHQILAELTVRAPHRGPVNVGQIYSTLERLGKQGLVESAGATDDRLPLHALTESGSAAALTWMTTPGRDPLPDWTELLDQLLITSSVDPAAAGELARRHRALWTEEVGDVTSAIASSSSATQRLALLARRSHARSVLEWIADASDALADPAAAAPFDADRPRRGRRPRPAADEATL